MNGPENEAEVSNEELRYRASEIVKAYVSAHALAPGEVGALLRTVHETLASLGAPPPEPEAAPQPATTVRKSITDDYLVCLEDGARLKMLKRYLRTRYYMSPDEYRARWGLPADYPMVAPAYARKRSELARKIGLGRPRAKSSPARQ